MRRPVLTWLAPPALLAACAGARPALRAARFRSSPRLFGLHGQAGLGHEKVRRGRGQPAGHRCRLPDAQGRRLAVDAAIAVQMVLTLVEPQSSGIGGGAFLLHFNGREVEAFDGRETAPAAADERLFLGADGKPMAFYDGVVGGRSSACRARCACWRWRTGSTASCPGPRCSSRPSSWPRTASGSARG
jgi:gamma-glutamyltranspeptidase/glutathione hydrolase